MISRCLQYRWAVSCPQIFRHAKGGRRVYCLPLPKIPNTGGGGQDATYNLIPFSPLPLPPDSSHWPPKSFYVLYSISIYIYTHISCMVYCKHAWASGIPALGFQKNCFFFSHSGHLLSGIHLTVDLENPNLILRAQQ